MASGDMNLYGIHVHALKSASGSIGAEQVSKAAAALEHAKDKGDLRFIQAMNPEFIIDFKQLLDDISPLISKTTDKSDVDTEQLKQELTQLRAALVDNDLSVINTYAKNLQKYLLSESIGDVINKILQSKISGEYEEAVILIDSLMDV